MAFISIPALVLKYLLERVIHLDFLKVDGNKKYIGLLLYLAHKFVPGFPALEVEQLGNLSEAEILIIWGLISDSYKHLGKLLSKAKDIVLKVVR
jgi:hypothetical protein